MSNAFVSNQIKSFIEANMSSINIIT